MTDEDWKIFEDAVFHFGGRLIIEGFEIFATAHLDRKKMKVGIFLYINGWFKGEFYTKDCEERRRFVEKKSRFVFPPKLRRALKKINRKGDWNRRVEFYSSCWSSFRLMKKHFIANNKSIELKK